MSSTTELETGAGIPRTLPNVVVDESPDRYPMDDASNSRVVAFDRSPPSRGPVQAEEGRLRAGDTAARAFVLIARSALAQIAANAAVLREARRLEAVQTPMLERLRAYEERIQELEHDLADQSKENRELLKLKIGLLREKIESERTASRSVNFN